MTELKTLKDFGEVLSTPEEPFKDWHIWDYVRRKLRQEAINDIKELNTNRSSNPNYSKNELDGIVRWIEWKFNITKEDLT